MLLKLIAQADRRSPDRLPTPACPRCGHDEAIVGRIRTPCLVSFRCMACGNDLVVNTRQARSDQPDFSSPAPSEA